MAIDGGTVNAIIGGSVFVIGIVAFLIDVAWEAALAQPSRRPRVGSKDGLAARRVMVYTLMGAHAGEPFPRP